MKDRVWRYSPIGDWVTSVPLDFALEDAVRNPHIIYFDAELTTEGVV